MELEKTLDENLGDMEWKYLLAGILALAALIAVTNLEFQEPNTGEKKVKINLKIVKNNENLTQTVEVKSNSTVLNTLNQSYPISYKKSKMGYYITGIDGLSANKTHFWIYLVNGTPPNVGVGQYRIDSSVNVTFLYLTQNQSKKYFK